MKLSIRSANPNYVAKVVCLPPLRKHPNANKLALVTIDGNIVITGINAKEGEPYIYFPLESAINKSFLSFTDSFAHPELNRDSAKKGFFGDHGRVKAVRLRGTPSEGYIVPVSSVVEWLVNIGISCSVDDFTIGTEFDHIDNQLFCEKYVNQRAIRAAAEKDAAEKRRQGKVKRASRLVENQFRFHVDTKQLKKEIGNLSPDDVITISYKLHGASAVISRILCKRTLKWYERIAKKIGIKVDENNYDFVYSSRKVIKNEYEESEKRNLHFYDTDIWALAAAKINPSLQDGLTIYAELVGQTPTGKWIQKSYDYGTEEKAMDVYVYRITMTNASGHVIEFTTAQVKRYCDKYGLKMVPILYHGKVRDLFPAISTTEHWHDNLLAALKEKYNEKDCYMCKNKVPEEGIVLAVEKDYFEAYKLKSFRFFERESAELDSGDANIEDVESGPETIEQK